MAAHLVPFSAAVSGTPAGLVYSPTLPSASNGPFKRASCDTRCTALWQRTENHDRSVHLSHDSQPLRSVAVVVYQSYITEPQSVHWSIREYDVMPFGTWGNTCPNMNKCRIVMLLCVQVVQVDIFLMWWWPLKIFPSPRPLVAVSVRGVRKSEGLPEERRLNHHPCPLRTIASLTQDRELYHIS